jgi:hypothetical protein
MTQGQTGNNFIIAHPAPQQSELETSRRKSLLATLRQEYVFSPMDCLQHYSPAQNLSHRIG